MCAPCAGRPNKAMARKNTLLRKTHSTSLTKTRSSSCQKPRFLLELLWKEIEILRGKKTTVGCLLANGMMKKKSADILWLFMAVLGHRNAETSVLRLVVLSSMTLELFAKPACIVILPFDNPFKVMFSEIRAAIVSTCLHIYSVNNQACFLGSKVLGRSLENAKKR